MNTTHSFDVKTAEKYGINAALMLSYIAYWVQKNKENGNNLHEGRYWTYNTVKALHEQFTYLTTNKISHALKVLEEAGLIIMKSFNKSKWDKTNWFTLTDAAEAIFFDHDTEIQNRDSENQKSISPKSKIDVAEIKNRDSAKSKIDITENKNQYQLYNTVKDTVKEPAVDDAYVNTVHSHKGSGSDLRSIHDILKLSDLTAKNEGEDISKHDAVTGSKSNSDRADKSGCDTVTGSKNNSESADISESGYVTVAEDKIALKGERYPKDFEEFWNAYPKKKGKRQAYGQWRILAPSKELRERILGKISLAVTSYEWQKEGGRFIKTPANWLESGGWDDEYLMNPPPPAKAANTAYRPMMKHNHSESELEHLGLSFD